MSDSGTEIVASLAFFATLLRAGRDAAHPPPRAIWPLVGLCGVILGLTRPLGPVWIVFDLLVWVALLGPRAAIAAVRGARMAPLSGAAILVAIALNRYWESTYESGTVVHLLPSAHQLATGVSQFALADTELVGYFGYLNVRLSPIAWVPWGLAAAALAVVAWRLSGAAIRRSLAIAVALVIAFPIYFVAASYIYSGFGLQGRHILPFVVVLPILVGEALRRSDSRLVREQGWRLLAGAALLAGVVQLVAWWTDAHHYAVGAHGSVWFLGSAQWSPPGGWIPWTLLACAGALALASCSLSSLRAARAS